MTMDSVGLRVPSRAECVDLLASTSIGRIVFTDRALPAVQPVNFVLDGENVVIRTGLGTRLAAAAHNTVVAFEADEFDEAGRTGWSVTVIGHARAVTDPAEIDRANLHARKALFASGDAVIAGTTVDDRHYLKFTLLNPETTLDDLAVVLDLIADHVEQYLGESLDRAS